MTAARQRTVPTTDGGVLAVQEAGPADGPAVLVHHGTPSAGRLSRAQVESAEARGLRLIAYDRPGYAGSTAQPGRSVADVVRDVARILDVLGVDRFATYGFSGGGPHALACAALLGGRCMAAASIAGVGPCDADDLDWLAGMGEGNLAEFAAAEQGIGTLTEFCEQDARQLLAVTPDQLAEAMRPHLSHVDAAVLTGELAAFLHGSMVDGLEPGVHGWVDDDIAFLTPWGFDVGAIAVPVLVWQGDQDLMVPAAHGRWLREHVAGAEGEVLAGEGHLTLAVHRIDDAHAWLAGHLG